MLCQFSFKNFMSYKDETVFDFQAEAIPDLDYSLIKLEKASDLLTTGVLYGPNGGGKSNLLKALNCLIDIVVRPVRYFGKNREPLIIQTEMVCIPFAFDDKSKNSGTEFEIFFRKNRKEFRYYIRIFDGEIHSERLNWRTLGGKHIGTVFERENNAVSLGASINKNNVNIQVNPKMPYLSFLAINYDFPIIAEVITWFESCIVESYVSPNGVSGVVMVEGDIKRSVIRALNDLDIDISDYRYNSEDKKVYTTRRVNEIKYELSYDNESDGTKKLLGLLPTVITALSQGRLLIIDELDAKLHPKLLRYIIKLFHDPKFNKHGAQLLFTSHDLTTMKNDVFRRDEIWFAYENERHESKIYSLYDIRDEHGKHVNNSAAYDKQYLEGRYGADPYLQNILGGEWDEHEAN